MKAINSKPGGWIAFFNIHSYGNWWLTPWGYLFIYLLELNFFLRVQFVYWFKIKKATQQQFGPTITMTWLPKLK